MNENKELAEYHLENKFYKLLKETRQEEGLSIFEVAKLIKEVFTKEEVESLIRELKNMENLIKKV